MCLNMHFGKHYDLLKYLIDMNILYLFSKGN